ncbi:2-dehydro-3-deoxy-6-phosphogalactonate aldolase [Exilibacterium tricleocarpae]|uniref:2-dehydro-3-deoxy-6-phosphogalactonate aldolase n=1 Tax=Exilibacterium tricleocarpae TaxID=2591008 RepID=UPI0015D400D7|nr:2-dehydro-3-deoxy-6-phosphogalactonate aldolase [Exilibacterium tricleocarpae]
MSSEQRSGVDRAFAKCPIVAILRGVTPEEVIGIGDALYRAGIRIVEIPLNSPRPLESIGALSSHFNDRMIVGAGTVLTSKQVEEVANAGGQVCVSPNTDVNVITSVIAHGMVPMPGVGTATEAFAAVSAGAQYLKLFPAGAIGASWIKAVRVVLPAEAKVLAVGGVSAANVGEFFHAGCQGLGAGTELFVPGRASGKVYESARVLVTAVNSVMHPGDARPGGCEIKQCAVTQSVIGESPLWRPVSKEVAWVDPVTSTLFLYNRESRTVLAKNTDRPVSSIMESADNRLFGVSTDVLVEIFPQAGTSKTVAKVPLGFADCRLNDAAMDPKGRVWCGSMSNALFAGQGELFRIDPDGEVHKLKDGLGVTNGLGWSPDFKQFYLVDTLHRTLIAFDCDIELGTITKPRVVTDFMGVPGKPDGLCVAPDGAIWVAMWGGSRLVRVAPRGVITREVILPTPNVSSCCFAGDSNSIYVSTSRFRLSNAALEASPWSGSLLVIDLSREQRESGAS